MSGLKESSKIGVIAITNKPWMLDSGLISRFTKRSYVPLPGEVRYWAHMYYDSNLYYFRCHHKRRDVPSVSPPHFEQYF